MAKRFVQDVVPSGRRSIRNIPLPESRGGEVQGKTALVSEKPRKVTQEVPARDTKPEKITPKPKNSSKGSRWWLWVGGVVVALVAVYFASYMFVTAKVTVTPKAVTTPVSVSGAAKLNATDSGLGYTIVTLEREGSKEVPASGEEKVEKKATGKVTIYNNAGSAPQQLVANTRFESTGGLIYRIPSAVTVPGSKTTNGVTTPGSLTVTVVADQAGEKYNIGLSDFTIPGFKGDAKFDKITAKSDPSSPIGGGFIGTAKKVTSADLSAARVSIEAKLKVDLEDQIQSQIPDTHVLFKNGTTFSFAELPQGTSANPSTALIREKGTVYGILFDRSELSKFLAEKLIANENRDVMVSNLDELSFTLDNISSFNPATTKEISFKLSGTGRFLWNVDSAKLSSSLAGKKRAQIKDILSDFEAVNKANVSIRPLWILTLPKDPAKITVQIEEVQ